MRRHDTGNGSAASAADLVPPLEPGDRLSRAEFLRRWNLHPEIKRAELIGGVVYMPSPLTRKHAVTDTSAAGWLWTYHAHTPGTEVGANATTLMEDEETPQPDEYLRVLPEYGGRSRNEGKYLGGVPELIMEISVSSASIDMNQKYALYERMGVLEYIVVLTYEQEIRWHRLGAKGYKQIEPSTGSVWKSKAFPGLWLDGKAMLANDAAKVLATQRKGLRSAEHGTFVKRLARRKK